MKLRALEPEDLSAFYLLENDMEAWDTSTTTVPFSRYLLKQYIATCKNDIFLDGEVRLAIDLNGELVGIADLTNFNPQHRRAEVGIIILPDKRGKGMGKQALELLADYARRILGLHQIYAIVAENNNTAQHLFSACNFQQTASFHDWLLSHDGSKQNALLYQQIFVV